MSEELPRLQIRRMPTKAFCPEKVTSAGHGIMFALMKSGIVYTNWHARTRYCGRYSTNVNRLPLWAVQALVELGAVPGDVEIVLREKKEADAVERALYRIDDKITDLQIYLGRPLAKSIVAKIRREAAKEAREELS